MRTLVASCSHTLGMFGSFQLLSAIIDKNNFKMINYQMSLDQNNLSISYKLYLW